MTTLELIPHLSHDAKVALLVLFLVAVGIAVLMAVLEHLATEWQAARWEADQPAGEGDITTEASAIRRQWYAANRPQIPEQRQPDHDQDGDRP